MAVTHEPVFGQVPTRGEALCTAANTTLTASPDDTQQLIVAGPNGALITAVGGLPLETIAAAVGYLYAKQNGASALRLIATATIAANTVSTTSKPAHVAFTLVNGDTINETTPLRLAPLEELHVGVSVAIASGFLFQARGMNL